ncbi:hypothetical protein [Paenarthrobacter sp. YJN-5]|uniref:hypothetical protein n=1 Tax=Paenarthrobacter sp. YJN-5 TaxID=2735316 RepID=UPI0018786951|nr:hypothetical protein [Paenarthrobacter sp. YJN-5]QOT15463.1 hypothetical protein HMI59_01930 [Paenarthrobacter sp. YJN-5]
MPSTQLYPSTAFPAFPSIAVDPPEGWTPRVVPDAVGALMGPAVPGSYVPNVVITVSRRTPDYGLKDIAKSVDAFLSTLPDAVLLGTEPVVINGRDWHIREARYTHPDAGSLTQFTAVTVVQRDVTTDVVQLTGSCRASDDNQDLKAIYALVASTEVG